MADPTNERQILRDLLTSADFEVIEAVDGEAGVAAAATHRPDLILMDIQLPGLDGYEASVASRPTQHCMLSQLSSLPRMHRRGITIRPVRRVAMPISPSPTARVSYWRRSVNTYPRPRR
jgi:CheY-like chemotaxis protein